MLNWKVVSFSLGSFVAVSFTLCMIWGLFMPEAEQMYPFWEQILPGFKWISWLDFIIGLVGSFIYGIYAGIVYVPIHNFFNKRWSK